MLRTSASAAPGTCHRFFPGACPSGRVRGEQAPLDLFLGIFFFSLKSRREDLSSFPRAGPTKRDLKVFSIACLPQASFLLIPFTLVKESKEALAQKSL